MSSSILFYHQKHIDVDDSMAILSLHYIKKLSENRSLPAWCVSYFQNVVDGVIEVKPIGWMDLELDDYFDDPEKNHFFIEIIDDAIDFLKRKVYVTHHEINEILRMQETEGFEVPERKLSASHVTEVLNGLKGLLK